ncbi:MAG: hypothetical protein IJU25_08485 [Lachnospiraceae bacterium]|nr:hypothetical protein [Lachnospiraceae bacterium]
MTYTLLPELTRGYLLTFATVILIMYIYDLIRLIDLHTKKILLIASLPMFLITFVLYQGMIMYQQEFRISFDIPVKILVPALIALFGHSVFLQGYIKKWQNENISAMSVKEAFDKLPEGLTYYLPDGLAIMINNRMQEISRNLFGKGINDVTEFWDLLNRNQSERRITDENQLIVTGKNGNVYSFKKDHLQIDDADVFELTAVDISKEYELTRELESRQNQEQILNKRLRALMDTIEYVTMNRELLQLKSALHDNIGQSILIAKRYLHAPGSVDRKRMLEFWQDNIRHLINDEPEVWELPYYVIEKEADRLGIRLNIIGKLPDEADLIPIMDAAISVHVGNVMKHADGSEVTIAVKEEPSCYRISLTNDGALPDGEVVEKGGLQNLRHEIEGIGGKMEIVSRPAFDLKITLPKANAQ